MNKAILIIMTLLFVGTAAANLSIVENLVVIDDNLTYTYVVFNEDGLLITPDSCSWELWQGTTLNATGSDYVETPIDTGLYTLNIYCEHNTTGGYSSVEIENNIKTLGGQLWKPVENWTFPVIYLLITFIIIGVALGYGNGLLGVLGSVMLIFSYFIVGATSPLLFAPLLIIGLLLTFRFATM